MKEIFAPGGLIARHHPDYEYRPGQIAMAEAVEEALQQRRHLLVEAGTGTGKTLAYLVPAVAAGQRIIVSTGTKNLQEQLFQKDIPFLQQTLPWKFKASYLKGRSNYLCLNRLGRADSLPMLVGLEEVDHFDVVRRWAAETSTGDRAELAELPENISFWRHIDARSDICIGSQCPSFDPCFITRARQEALDSDIVIVNHHLFFADLALRGRDWGQVLPDYQAVIFDEAHQIEEVASQYFGASVSSFQIEDLIGDITRLAITDVDASREMTRACARVMRFADQFWLVLMGPRQLSGAGPMEGRFQIQPAMFVRRLRDGTREPTSAGESYLGLKTAMERLRAALQTVKDAPAEMEQILRRIEQLVFDLEFVLLGEDENFVACCERRGRGVLLQATPIDASGILEDRLFSKIDTAVLTSATLTSAGSFSFIRERLGIAEADELVAESNFDYARQTLLYLPPRMPDPRSEHFSEAAASEIIGLLEASRGRAFVLSTSYAQMQTLRRLVEDELTFPILMQGEGSRGGLLEKFRSTPHAVLFATSSFWQGVDVRGEALSCVIIDKLPFAVPSDPIVAARQRSIDRRGGSSFSEYSVPSAIIALRQGLGRLIRSTTDRGILAVLDPRLVTKSYGRSFLESLPPCRTTRSIDEVREFFSDEVAHLRA
jgi:ATP-dependent DNA helicase DinG